jgi:hypothetical protein
LFFKEEGKEEEEEIRRKKTREEEEIFFLVFFFFCCVDFLISLLPKTKLFWWCIFGKLEGIDEMKLRFKPKNKLKQLKHL